jgi:hypothetical protein
MLSNEEYIKLQELLKAQYLAAAIEEKEEIANKMTLLHLRKEMESGACEIQDDALPADQGQFRVSAKHGIPIANQNNVAILSVKKITPENIRTALHCKNSEGGNVDLEKYLSPNKIAEIMNFVQDIKMQDLAKNKGYNLKKVDKGDSIDYELTPTKSSSKKLDLAALDKRVHLVQEDVQNMKKNGKETSGQLQMNSIPERAPNAGTRQILSTMNDVEQSENERIRPRH